MAVQYREDTAGTSGETDLSGVHKEAVQPRLRCSSLGEPISVVARNSRAAEPSRASSRDSRARKIKKIVCRTECSYTQTDSVASSKYTVRKGQCSVELYWLSNSITERREPHVLQYWYLSCLGWGCARWVASDGSPCFPVDGLIDSLRWQMVRMDHHVNNGVKRADSAEGLVVQFYSDELWRGKLL